MKDFLSKNFYGNSIETWSIALLYILGAIIFGKVLYWFINKIVKKATEKTKSKIDNIIVDMIEEPVVFAIVILGIWLGQKQLVLPSGIQSFATHVFSFLITINVTWLISRIFVSLVNEYIQPLTSKTASDLDDQLFPIIKKGINTIIWILGVIVGLNNAGYDVGALIAGLGIGGIALAMAAKDSISNFFGGFTIFTDKPFKINDRIRLSGFDGTVIEIGLRSFRLRTLDGTVVTIPNSQVTASTVENVTLEPTRKIVLNLGLTYDTTPEHMQKAMNILKDIASKSDSITEDYKIAFTSFGDFSLGILYIYYIKKEADILDTQTEMNMNILNQFNSNGLNFAFPTQTIQIEKN